MQAASLQLRRNYVRYRTAFSCHLHNVHCARSHSLQNVKD